jgi:hypothetical protein
MRTSAADRERAIEVLKTAYGDGRLTKDELDTRIERAVATGTYADLAQVTADLPGGSAFSASPTPVYPRPRYYGGSRGPASVNGLAVASLVCSLFGFFPLAPSVVSVILGHAAHGQIRRDRRDGKGAQPGGYGIATAGMVLGYLGLVTWLLIIVAGFGLAALGTPGPAGP